MKIGIVGGYGHALVKALPEVELAWACDGYDEEARARARDAGSTRTHASMDEMLQDFSPDLIYIGTTYAQNGPLAIRALEAGLDVISEKPLATDWKSYHRLKELTDSGERRVIAELAMRWSPPLQKARRLLQDGAIGKPVMVQAQKTYKFGASRPEFYKSRELFGGIIPWVAVHAIDFASWCTGLSYESVTASQGNQHFPEYGEMEDHAAMFFRMTGGVPCLISADFLRPKGASSHSDDRLRVTGTEGVLEVRNSDVFLTDNQRESHWSCPTDEGFRIRAAKALVAAASGHEDAEISVRECLHVTAATLAARDAADQAIASRQIPGGFNP